MKPPETIYANKITKSGLYSPSPITLYLNKLLGGWSDSASIFHVKYLGRVVDTKEKGNIITFASVVKEDVQFWTKGVSDTMELLRAWAHK